MQPHPLPPPAPRPEPDEPRAHFAARCFRAVLADAAVLFTMSDELIELCEYGARFATDARNMSPQYYDAIAAAEREISAAVRRRRRMAEQDAAAALDTTIAPRAPGRPDGPAVPVSPYPQTQPPSGAYADLEPTQAQPEPAARGTRTPAGRLIRF